MKANLEMLSGETFRIDVPEHCPRIISGWSSSLGIKGGKDRIIFAHFVSTMSIREGVVLHYRQALPEKFAVPDRENAKQKTKEG